MGIRAFIIFYRNNIAEFFYIVILLRNYLTCLIRFSADDHLVVTP